jgi:hypothetical protein
MQVQTSSIESNHQSWHMDMVMFKQKCMPSREVLTGQTAPLERDWQDRGPQPIQCISHGPSHILLVGGPRLAPSLHLLVVVVYVASVKYCLAAHQQVGWHMQQVWLESNIRCNT